MASEPGTIFGTISGIALLALAFYAAFILPTKWLKIEHINHSIGLRLRVLQLSDLHVENLRIQPARIQRLILQEKPDIILITGDFTQQEKHFPKLQRYLDVLRESGLPLYAAVLGNHDYQIRKVPALIKLLKSYGIHVLRNESILMQGYCLIGIDDYASGKSRIVKSFESVPNGLPRIVITHDPNIVVHLQEPYDYLMAGHLHGKQFNIPFFFKFRPMGKLPAMGFYKGIHKSPWGWYYISKGLGQTGINARLFVRSEATVHEL